jgi:hypothetical protein
LIDWFICLQYWGLNPGPTPWATPPALFCERFLQDRVSWTIHSTWLQTCDPPDLCLLNSYDYRNEPLVPSSFPLLIHRGMEVEPGEVTRQSHTAIKRLVKWLNWYSASLASVRPWVQTHLNKWKGRAGT